MSSTSPKFTKVIFLDIDGVLVTPRSMYASKKMKWVRTHDFDIYAAGLIKGICEKHGVKIVISSSWRHYSSPFIKPKRTPQISDLYRNVREHALLKYVHKDWATKDFARGVSEIWRGHEIEEWLKRHPEVEQYLILDDDCDMLESQKENFIHTDGRNGLSVENYLLMDDFFSGLTTATKPLR